MSLPRTILVAIAIGMAVGAVFALVTPPPAGAHHNAAHSFGTKVRNVCKAQTRAFETCDYRRASCTRQGSAVILGSGQEVGPYYFDCWAQVTVTRTGFSATTCAWHGWITGNLRRVYRYPTDDLWTCHA